MPKPEESSQSGELVQNTNNHHRHPQYLACGILCLGGFLGGNVTGWSSVALPSIILSGDFQLGPSDLSWIASITNIGLFLSAPTAGYLIRKMGRKGTLLCSALPYIIGWTALAIPINVWILYGGRFLTGLGLGLTLITGSIYLSEIAEPDLRGTLSGIWFVVSRLGILFSYVVGSFLPYNQLSASSAALSIAFGVTLFYLPESPRWLMSEWRTQEATDSLCWLRSCDKSCPSSKILVEIEEIQEAVRRAEDRKNALTFSSFFTNGTVLRPMVVALILMFFKEACGGNVFSYYTVQIFEKTGSAFDSHTSGIVVGVAQLIPLFATTFFVDKVGRKILLILFYSVMSLCLALIAFFYEFKTEIEAYFTTQVSGWLSLILFVVYHASYSGGPFVLTWTVSSEIIPSNVIGIVSGFASAFGWISAFAFTRYYDDMNNWIGMANTFWVYAAFSIAGAAFIHLLVPETVGRSLENIHQNQQNNNNTKEDIVSKI